MKKFKAKTIIIIYLIMLIHLNIIIFESRKNLYPSLYQDPNDYQLVSSNPTLWTWNYDDSTPEDHTYVHKTSDSSLFLTISNHFIIIIIALNFLYYY